MAVVSEYNGTLTNHFHVFAFSMRGFPNKIRKTGLSRIGLSRTIFTFSLFRCGASRIKFEKPDFPESDYHEPFSRFRFFDAGLPE